ncbi:spinocerebellar ataxia type 10 protein domain-containing protein, partial [Hysterangium stoloniferum]
PTVWTLLSDNWQKRAVDPSELSLQADSILCLARFTRNLAAGVQENQISAFGNENELRTILHRLTSFSELQDETLYPVTRMLVQTLSNIVTMNGSLAQRLWNIYICLSDDQEIVVRLLASPDIATVNSTLVLILNSINADQHVLSSFLSSNGIRILVKILDHTEDWVVQDVPEKDDGECFAVSYRIFVRFLQGGLAAKLYDYLSMDNEPITPQQTTFLKILDSYSRDLINDDIVYRGDYKFLVEAFVELCAYFQSAIKCSLGITTSSSIVNIENGSAAEHSGETTLQNLDLRLPKVSAGLILVSQCLNTLCLREHENLDADKRIEPGCHAIHISMQGDGVVESLIDTLRLLDLFLPRIVFGKAAASPGETTIPTGSTTDITGFTYLKRDLVRILGTICHDQKEMQVRVRECGGIQVVMGLCVIDERNPYLQEHALFALRNILHKNPDNQAFVEAMKPVNKNL